MNPIKQSALKVLELLLSLTPDGDITVANQQLCECLAAIHISSRDVLDAIKYLADQRAVKTIGDIDGATVLLSRGRFLCHEWQEEVSQQSARQQAPYNNVVNIHGHLTNSPIQQNVINSSQTLTQTPSAASSLKGRVDFAIITIRDDEFKAVLQRFPHERSYSGAGRTYSISHLPLSSLA